jgi:tetratricopeptide (TPR) repeat protein
MHSVWDEKPEKKVVPLIFHVMLLLSFFLCSSDALAAEGQGSDAVKQFTFAESLFNEGDYYRAITEYKRFIFFYPGNDIVEKSAFRIAESYYKAKRWTETVEAFDAFSKKYPNSSMATEALYLKGLSEKELKRHDNALSTFQEIIVKAKSEEYADKAIYQSALILLEMGEYRRAKQTFSLMPEDSALASSAHSMTTGLQRMDEIPQKSPATAGTLAAILPGAGHLYTERYRDALVAFFLNGAFILAAVELFKHDNPVAGGIVTLFELGWYTGNIYSAVSSAHKYNKKAKEDFIQHLKESSDISFFYNPATSTSQLMFSFRF